MLQQPVGSDFVIATGESHTLGKFVEATFARVGLHWRDHTDLSPALIRPTDLAEGRGDPTKARDVLGWSPIKRMKEVVEAMVEAEQREPQCP